MRVLGNVIWFVFGGFLVSLTNFVMGLFFIALVVTAPIGLGLLQYSKFCLFPFTTDMVSKSDMGLKQNPLWRAYSSIFKLLYLPFGLIGVVVTLPVIALNAITIIALPQALAMAKSLGTILNPVGKICVSKELSSELKARKAATEADRLLGIKHD